ncbi:hypothetical protein ABZX40_22010 [Streptomyces sp. NPDC004610]|uniref:hypothetical protein n=1 Tax=unclassified Streptomyces TaxID=2593676 RepID=UPI0033ABB6FD
MQSRWRGRVHELTAAVGALAAALVLMLWAAPSASAGGPTSVLIVSPQSMEATALYAMDRRYMELERFVSTEGGGSADPPPAVSEAGTRQINVTWMAHDIAPHRLDRLFLTSSTRDVWVHTVADPASGSGVWHLASHTERLRTLLKELGVMGEVSPDGSSGVFPAPVGDAPDAGGVQEPAAEPTPEPTPEQTAGSSRPVAATAAADTEDWWWALPGLAAGAVLALALRPLALRLPGVVATARLRRSEEGPRQELRDR